MSESAHEEDDIDGRLEAAIAEAKRMFDAHAEIETSELLDRFHLTEDSSVAIEFITWVLMHFRKHGVDVSREEILKDFPQFSTELREHFDAVELAESEIKRIRKEPEISHQNKLGTQIANGAEKNLLLGVLALQLNFISDAQLVSAATTWIRDKSVDLGQLLLDAGSIKAEEFDLLNALLEKHLERHGNDPEKSLAAITPIPLVQKELESLNDADVSIAATIIGVNRDQFSREDSLAPRVIGSRDEGVRYRVTRLHARGGLGEVFVARDLEVNRDVALKQIQPRHAQHEDSRNRFLREAEVTGGLEHPGIVPIYGLGQYEDGRPFYAMRFIQGDSLKEAITKFHHDANQTTDMAEVHLQLRHLLGRFIDVCNAIEYAHSRGVLHRDLKPGNIMLGKYGETLVVDWGLAKCGSKDKQQGESDELTLRPGSGSGTTETQYGTAIGTPAYMSPEQAAGKIDRLDATSDVYSLGATLYCLLTGKPPFIEQDLTTLLTKVEAGDFVRPRKIDSNISSPLEAICLKAMSLSQENRYQSPRFLADDIERWLADEPISARRDPWNARIARLIRRHPLALTATGAGMFCSILTLVVSLSIQLPLAIDDSIKELRQSEITPPGESAMLTQLVFLAAHSAENGAAGEKLRAYRQAIEIQKRIVAEQPDVPQLRFDLSNFYVETARLAGELGKYRESLDNFDSAIKLKTELSKTFPDLPTLNDELASASADTAWLLAVCPDEKLHDGERAVKLALSAIQHKGDHRPVYLDTLAAAYARVGNFALAAQSEERAIKNSHDELKKSYSDRLQLYRMRVPYMSDSSMYSSKQHL